MLREGVGRREVGEGCKGREAIANAQHEMAVPEIPEVLGMVVQMPGGAGEGLAGGEFQHKGVNHTVLIVLGFGGETGNQAVRNEREQEMLVVDVVEREHGAAVEQKLGRKGLEA